MCLTAHQALAENSPLQALLQQPQPPVGVVIEIVESNEDDLPLIMPQVQQAISLLQKRFPDVEIAVVSHGGEQFALQSKRLDEYPALHRDIQSLSNNNIPVYVCGAHAGWYGIAREDFPVFVDVSPSGPRQINDYRALGYSLLKISLDE